MQEQLFLVYCVEYKQYLLLVSTHTAALLMITWHPFHKDFNTCSQRMLAELAHEKHQYISTHI